MDKDKYIKWYNLAREEINDEYLIPQRTPDEIRKLVSNEDWLMFVLQRFSDTLDAKNYAAPNVFIDLYSKDNVDYCRLGLTFNNVGATDVLKNILSKYCLNEKEQLTNALLGLRNNWMIRVERKIKDTYYMQVPEYITVFEANSNKINANIVNKIIDLIINIREEGRKKAKLASPKYYSEAPSVNLLEASFELEEKEFKSRIKEAFNVLSICLNVKPDRDIKSIEKTKNKELEFLKGELEAKQKMWSKRDVLLSLGGATQEQIKNLEVSIKQIEEKIFELSSD